MKKPILILSLTLCLVVLLSLGVSGVTTDNLEAYFNFTTNFNDSSGNGNDGKEEMGSFNHKEVS